MAVLDPQTYEVKFEGKWRSVSFDVTVRSYAEAVRRCPACHGCVAINGAYSGTGFGKSMTHWRAHSGGPPEPDTYSGKPSPQTQALT